MSERQQLLDELDALQKLIAREYPYANLIRYRRVVLSAAAALAARDAEIERLRTALLECMSCMDSLRDFVAEGGSRHMIGASDAIRAADAALDAAHPLVAAERTQEPRHD